MVMLPSAPELSRKEGHMRSRGLSDHFMLQLDAGRLQPLLARVNADDTLCLEIRDSCINIYYRGGSLAKVAEDQPGHFTISMDYNYFGKRRKDVLRDLPKTLPDAGASEKWIEAFPRLKETMDLHFGANPGEEREYKQLVVRDNNGRYGSTASDYFILDMEYGDSTLGAQFGLAPEMSTA